MPLVKFVNISSGPISLQDTSGLYAFSMVLDAGVTAWKDVPSVVLEALEPQLDVLAGKLTWSVYDDTDQEQDGVILSGAYPTAHITLTAPASDGDVVSVGGHVFEFDNNDPPVAAAATSTAVRLGGTIKLCVDRLVAALNGTATAAEATPGTATLPAVSAENVADTTVLIVPTTSVDGTATQLPAAGNAFSFVLAATMFTGDDWCITNTNLSGGKAAGYASATMAKFTVTAEMKTAGVYVAKLPFTVSEYMWQLTTAAGVTKYSPNMTVVSVGAYLIFTIAGADPQDPAATDIIRYWVASA